MTLIATPRMSVLRRSLSVLRRSLGAGLLALLIALATGGCDSVTEVEPNDNTVPADRLEDPNSFQARLVGAQADFFFAYDMAVAWQGLYADELYDPGNEVEQRRVQPANATIGAVDEAPEGIDGLWTPMQRAAFVTSDLQADIQAGNFPDQVPDPANSPQLARVSLFAGYAKVTLADLFCSLAFNGEGPELTPAQTYQQALEDFTAAIDASNADPEIRSAALVGRARAHLMLGNAGQAVADASQVARGFEYAPDAFSTNSQREENDIWNMLTDSQRYTVDPRYRAMTIDDTGTPDPRVDVFQSPDDPFGIDGSTPQFQARKYASPVSPIRIASWFEAQYIVAEVEGGQAAVDIINDVRVAQGIGEAYAGGTDAEIRAKVIDEKRRTLFLDGQRMGDLRRYAATLSAPLPPEASFPTGEIVSIDPPSEYQDGVCFPLPDAERDTNPGL
jgi:hypothetical protein